MDWYDDVTNVKVANAGTKNAACSIQDPNDNDRISDRYIEDGSYIRLKNITLDILSPANSLTNGDWITCVSTPTSKTC